MLLARTLMTEPGLVLLDEPTAGLDVGGREELVADLGTWAVDATRPPLALVTHHLEEIPPGFTHALVLRDGRVLASGPILETVTSEVLSVAFALNLRVEHKDGRFTAAVLGRSFAAASPRTNRRTPTAFGQTSPSGGRIRSKRWFEAVRDGNVHEQRDAAPSTFSACRS